MNTHAHLSSTYSNSFASFMIEDSTVNPSYSYDAILYFFYIKQMYGWISEAELPAFKEILCKMSIFNGEVNGTTMNQKIVL